MNMGEAIDKFISSKWSYGHFTSAKTERSYRLVLERHLEDVFNDDPTQTDRDDVMKTLERYPRPNTKGHARSVLVSFYTWLEENGYRKDNPARQTPKPKKQEVSSYRFTLDEVQRLLAACQTDRERRVVHIGLCAGLRNAELRGLQGRHFQRRGWIWVSKDIAKGSRERFVPVIAELQPLWDEINQTVGPDWYVLPSTYRRTANPKALSSTVLGRIVKDVAVRAGIDARVYPHLMRHGFAGQIARQAGPLAAQSMLGHKDIGTTQIYMGKPTLEDLSASVAGVRLAVVEAEVPSALLPVGTLHNAENPGSPDLKAFGRVLVAIGDNLRPTAQRLAGGLYATDWGAV